MKSESGRMKGDSNGKDENMKAENGRIKGDLKERTKEFALNIIGLDSQLPKRREAQVLGDQLLRSGQSFRKVSAFIILLSSLPLKIPLSDLNAAILKVAVISAGRPRPRSWWFSESETRARFFASFPLSSFIVSPLSFSRRWQLS